ncbi:MAG: gamma-glutamylcyclotransferase family protein [Planctomycetota bacterium]|jgi:gamma-glutamylcyclotransferase (GGCT)/AIG2-like uncharacterized protein YtfP|nr:gamma-glutamylcyclotransferase family protein [Planctomycetota bacterium]MDP6942144.1 gamma-glutamylcyclotransferase family protein [Planctomycetota bacterium]
MYELRVNSEEGNPSAHFVSEGWMVDSSQIGKAAACSLWELEGSALSLSGRKLPFLTKECNLFWATPPPQFEMQEICSLFVYGTLMEGECRFSSLEMISKPNKTMTTQASGILYDCGSYPGARFCENESLQGELFQFSEMAPILSHCDVVEGFRGFGNTENLFDRVLLELQHRGSTVLAWSYQLSRKAGYPAIPKGDWRAFNATNPAES